MAEETLKFCNKCQLSKPLSQFYIKVKHSNIYHSNCKLCMCEKKREYDQKKRNKSEIDIKFGTDTCRLSQSGIRNLSESDFEIAREMVRHNCSISKLSRFIDCCPTTTKKYIEQGIFN